ncbi:hypothetical protein C5C07_15290 [Haloferax sp. Atlit-4N]|nr:hypothetical protein C5C07_15290 [Haloferax sp. Atlit-4N]
MCNKNLRPLPFHHHILYALIHGAGELSARDLHSRCDKVSEKLYYGHNLTPVGKRSRRNKLAKLQEYDLIESEGPAQSRVYRVSTRQSTPQSETSVSTSLAE